MNDRELPEGFGPEVKVLAEVEGVRPPGLESDPELVATMATDIKAGREAPGGDDLTTKLVFSMRGRLIEGFTRRDTLTKIGITEIGRDDYTIDPLAVDEESELARAMIYQLNRRNLGDAKRQRAAWAAFLRDERKLSQSKIAKLMGVSQPAVSQWFSDFPEFARKKATTVVGEDGKTRISPATTPRKQAAAKGPVAWTPPFTPADDDPGCPECDAYGDMACTNMGGTDRARWHSERVDEVTDYRQIKATLVPIPADGWDLAPTCPTCDRSPSSQCVESGYDFEDRWHQARLEAWVSAVADDAREKAEYARDDAVDPIEPTNVFGRLLVERDRLTYDLGRHYFIFETDDDEQAEQMVRVVAEIIDYWRYVEFVLLDGDPAPEAPSSTTREARSSAMEAVACAQCDAQPGEACLTPSGGKVGGEGFHAKRIKAAGQLRPQL